MEEGQETLKTYKEKRGDREVFGVEEWRAGILAGSTASVPFDMGDEGRAASKCMFMLSPTQFAHFPVAERPGSMSEGFIRPKDEGGLAPLGPPMVGSTSKLHMNGHRRNTLRNALGFVLGMGILWIATGQLPTRYHLALMSRTNPAIAHTWRFIAPPSAVDTRRALSKRKELDRWIEDQRVIAWNRISTNIGPAAGASDGIIVASPSSGQHLTEPDYYVCPHSGGADL